MSTSTYYAVLGINASASGQEITDAYRALALKHHPDKVVGSSKDAEEQLDTFNRVSEAYEVLSNRKLRALYDQYGEKGLKSGIPDGKGGVVGGYAFANNGLAIFQQFFGTSNPYATFFQEDSSSGSVGAEKKKLNLLKPAEVVKTLECSLEELYNGSRRKVSITKRVLSKSSKGTTSVDKTLTINVKPGWKQGTKIRFTQEGDQGPGITPADVVFVLEESKHEVFSRDGDDLHLTAQISLLEALTGTSVAVETLDGRTVNVPVNDIVRPGYTKVVKGEGMPNSKTGEYGNLVMSFDVVYPERLTARQKASLTQALG